LTNLTTKTLTPIHHVPGRVRFRVPRLNRTDPLILQFSEQLKSQTGIKNIRVNPWASSLIINYDQTVHQDE
jgi:Cu2+-exporting ATPase